jgi:hypothetical protein
LSFPNFRPSQIFVLPKFLPSPNFCHSRRESAFALAVAVAVAVAVALAFALAFAVAFALAFVFRREQGALAP